MSSVWKEQRLQDHFVVLCSELDVDRIVPILRNERMLTTDEMETLSNPYFTTRVRREKLLIILPRKGRAHFQKFAECLVWSGQVELAKKIGVPVEKIPPSPYPSPPAGPSISATQQAEFFRLLTAMIPEHLVTSALPTAPAPPPYTAPPTHPQLASATTTSSYPHYPGQPHSQHIAHPTYSQPTAHLTQQPHQPSLPVQEHHQSGPREVFLLYCNDPSLKTTEDLDFSDDVLSLADVLVKCCGSRVKVHFDGYDNIPDPGNWSRWTEDCIKRSDLVLLVCSPTLIQKLHTNSHDMVPMKRGAFFADAIFNTITSQKFIPVFLNVGLDQNCLADVRSEPYRSWVPTNLRASSCYWLNVRAFENAMGNTEGMLPEEFGQKLSSLLQERRFEHLAYLVSRLTGISFTPQPTPTANPLPLAQPTSTAVPSTVPSAIISDSELMTIAERIPRDWQHLGIKLGVPYTTLEHIRRNHTFDTRQAAMEMFATWQRLKGDRCTRLALKEALKSVGYGRVAQEVFGRD